MKRKLTLILILASILSLAIIISSCGKDKKSEEHECEYSWQISQNATCTENGYETGTCSICQETISREIEKTGHSYNSQNTCIKCSHILEFTKGLQYTEVEDGYVVSGIGTATEKKIVIPVSHADKPVVGISQKAFYGNDYITSVYIPTGITYVSDNAFAHCISITSVFLGDDVSMIGENAFANCTALNEIILPNTMVEIGKNAFENTSVLNDNSNYENGAIYIGAHLIKVKEDLNESKFTVKDGTVTIASNAFENNEMIENVEFSKTLRYIGSYAFYNCQKLSYVEFTEKIDKTGACAFANCPMLKEVNICVRVEFGNWCFNNTSIEKATIIPYNLSAMPTTLKKLAFAGEGRFSTIPVLSKYTNLISLDCGTYRVESGTYPFKGLGNLEEIRIYAEGESRGATLGNGVYFYSWFGSEEYENSILIQQKVDYWYNEDEIFDCYLPKTLKKVTICGGSMRQYFFSGCSTIETFVIEDSVGKIGASSFFECTGDVYIGTALNRLTEKDLATVQNTYGFYDNAPNTFNLHFTGTLEEYCEIPILGYQFAEGINKLYVGEKEISGDLVIPNTVTQVGTYNFYCLDTITSITFPESMKEISISLAHCSSLKSIVISEGVTKISIYAYGCESLENVNIPSTVVSFRGSFYSDKLNYNEYDNAYYLGNKTNPYLVLCKSKSKDITSCTIHNSTKIIGSTVFSSHANLTEIVIPNGIVQIGNSAFYGCENLGSITLPNGLTEIAAETFSNCDSLTNIVIPNSVMNIGEAAFAYCDNLTSVTIPNAVTSIGKQAFRECISLVSITIPESTTSIGSQAFYGCSFLSEIKYNAVDLTERGNSIFVGIGTNAEKVVLTIGKNVVDIPTYSSIFSSTDITNVVFEEGCKFEIEGDVFSNCTKLTSVVIPETITVIDGAAAFSGCTSLVYNEYDNACYLGNETNPYFALIKTKTKDITACEINNNVKIICRYAFSNCDSLESIVIPNCVMKIGLCAFDNCGVLNDITIGSGVTTIEDMAFRECPALKSVNYIGNIEDWLNIVFELNAISIYCYQANPLSNGAELFFNGEKVTELTIPKTVTEINDQAFENCTSLRKVTIENGISKIGYKAFAGCENLTNVILSDTITTIEQGAFSNCVSLANVIMPDSIVSLGASVLSGCASLTDVVLPNAINSIPNSCFSNCSAIKTINIPDSVTNIGEKSFYNCTSITSITIPKNVIVIADDAFYSCSSLAQINYDAISLDETGDDIFLKASTNCEKATVHIGKEVKSIPSGLFESASVTDVIFAEGSSCESIGGNAFGNSSLVNIEIPNSIITIEAEAFSYCDSLKYNEYDNAYYLGNAKNPYLVLIKAKSTDISSCEIHSDTKLILSEAFYYCTSLESVSIPNGVVAIGQWAFSYCVSLKNIVIPDSTKTIDFEAFAYCSSLETVIMGNGIQKIDTQVFYGCSSLVFNEYDNAYYLGDTTNPYLILFKAKDEYVTSCIINENTKIIYNNAFRYCDLLEEITIPNNIIYVGISAFDGCDSLIKVNTDSLENWCNITFDDSILNSNDEVQLYIKGELINNLVIPNTVNEIKAGAFCGFKGTSITISNSVSIIGNSAFMNCENLTTLTIGNNVIKIGDSAFAYCIKLNEVTIPNNVTTIGEYAFSYCDNLANVKIPNSVTDIEYCAFYTCPSLENIIIPNSVTIVGNYAFSKCYKLTIYCEEKSKPNNWHSNYNPSNCPVYWYSEGEPTSEGNYWHYVDGVVTIW